MKLIIIPAIIISFEPKNIDIPIILNMSPVPKEKNIYIFKWLNSCLSVWSYLTELNHLKRNIYYIYEMEWGKRSPINKNFAFVR